MKAEQIIAKVRNEWIPKAEKALIEKMPASWRPKLRNRWLQAAVVATLIVIVGGAMSLFDSRPSYGAYVTPGGYGGMHTGYGQTSSYQPGYGRRPVGNWSDGGQFRRNGLIDTTHGSQGGAGYISFGDGTTYSWGP